ncbi:MAG: fibronectin type III domain-containing protein, partial [Oscillospiraceae bacterium]|nr:fibronectin type III domain-containing protein [Oscillospiraceae bacterium]
AARSCTITNLLPGVQYEFKVRARNEVNNALFHSTNGGEGNMGPTKFNPRYPNLTEAERIERMGGRGGWAVAPPVTPPGRFTMMNSNRYPQMQGQAGPGIKLYYGNPNRGPAAERYYGPNGEIWNHLGQRIDHNYNP